MVFHNPDSPPPGLFYPVIDEASLRCPSDPYEPPVRTPEEWMHGDDIWYPERVMMYGLAKEELIKQNYTEQHSEVSIAIAQSWGSEQIGVALGITTEDASHLVRTLYGHDLRHPFKIALTNRVVRTGMAQLILRSLSERSPTTPIEDLAVRAGGILGQRFQNRIKSFKLTDRENEISGLLLQGLTGKTIARRLQLSPGSVSHYVSYLYLKASCNTSLQYVHRLYGAASPTTPVVSGQL